MAGLDNEQRKIIRLIRRKAHRYGVRPALLNAQIGQESNYRRDAVSPMGARGPAQFMPGTAKTYGVDLYDNRVSDDIDGAARMMRDLLRRYGGDERKALAAYNAGEGAVDKYGGVPPYQETRDYVRTVLSRAGRESVGGTSGGAGSPAQDPMYRTVPGVNNAAARDELKRAYFQNSHDPNALLQLKAGLDQAQDTPSRRVRVRGSQPSVAQTGNAFVDAVTQEAQHINQAHVSYQWGGGHAGPQRRGSKVTPLDCSGAVSRVLGIDPRVSGEFEKWGKPGKGRVTVYSNAEHVLMEIDGHFWGTSGSNPGGGPGWIKRKDIPKGYLKGFTARHAG